MPIPRFDRYGLLPAGVHDCSLTEIRQRLGTNPHRRRLIKLLSDFISVEVRPLHDEHIYIDGSFVTDKERPGDVDVTLALSQSSAGNIFLRALSIMQRQEDFMEHYCVHCWISIPGISDFTAFFQYAGPKLAHKGLTEKHPKGILRLNDG